MIKMYGIHNEPKVEFPHASAAVSGSVHQKQTLLLPVGAEWDYKWSPEGILGADL